MKIIASYNKKINHALYGGGDYENSDHFCSMEIDVSDPEVEPTMVYEELHNECVENVMKSIAKEISSFNEGMSDAKFAETIRAYRLDNLQLNDTITEEMTRQQKIILEEFKKLKRK